MTKAPWYRATKGEEEKVCQEGHRVSVSSGRSARVFEGSHGHDWCHPGVYPANEGGEAEREVSVNGRILQSVKPSC
jgi:hypothetical protein